MSSPKKRAPKASTLDRHRRFAQYYIINFDPIEAYKAAGYKSDGASASAIASRLLANNSIQALIREEIEAQKKRLELSQDRVLLEHMRLGFSDFREYAKWDGSGFTWKDSDELTEDQSRAIESVEFTENITEYAATKKMKIKLYSKKDALDALSRYLGLYEKDNRRTITDERDSVKSRVNDLIKQTRERITTSQNGAKNGEHVHTDN